MKEQTLRYIMTGLVILGVSLVLFGIALIVFTEISITSGTDGILTIAGLIAGGLFISVPAKIYLTLQLMKYNDEKLKARNQANED